jgi:hypothetical protein
MIGLVAGCVGVLLASGAAACGSPSPSDSAAPTVPVTGTAPGGATTGTTSCIVVPDTEIVDPNDFPPDDPAAPDAAETPPDTAAVGSGAPAATTPAPPCVPPGTVATIPVGPPATDPTGSNPAPRLQALTAYLTEHYADTPWRSQLADYKLSTADDRFQLSIATRSTLPSDQAVQVCTAASHWSTTTFADGTITVTDQNGAPLASTPSARNTTCTAAS